EVCDCAAIPEPRAPAIDCTAAVDGGRGGRRAVEGAPVGEDDLVAADLGEVVGATVPVHDWAIGDVAQGAVEPAADAPVVDRWRSLVTPASTSCFVVKRDRGKT